MGGRDFSPHVAYIAIGSNLGDRIAFCREAVHQLQMAVLIKKVSSLYETAPVDYFNQGWFYNAVIEIETPLPPHQLLDACQLIEHKMGKKIEIPKGPRTIDLDLLFYDQAIIHEAGLTVPHPALPHRRFVLVPLSEIAPKLNHPTLQKTVPCLLSQLQEDEQIQKRYPPGWEGDL